VKKTFESGVYLAPKNIDQTTLLVGHFGEKRFNPDKYALLLLNDIMGGNVMSSRLGRRIRSTLGLSYGIYSRFGLSTDYGVFYVFAQTKGPATQQVLSEIRRILKEISTGETLTEAELEEHKKSVVNSLFAEYEPKFNFVKDEARFEYFGYPPNYLEYFRKKIQKVSLAQLRRVAKKYLRPDALKVLVVGDEGKIGQLQGVQKLSLEIL
ncbi:MAG: insulinase family protein, partial [bacterium]|nr:insulinase family protein [bacterium]